jgi:hypothetical protein
LSKRWRQSTEEKRSRSGGGEAEPEEEDFLEEELLCLETGEEFAEERGLEGGASEELEGEGTEVEEDEEGVGEKKSDEDEEDDEEETEVGVVTVGEYSSIFRRRGSRGLSGVLEGRGAGRFLVISSSDLC